MVPGRAYRLYEDGSKEPEAVEGEPDHVDWWACRRLVDFPNRCCPRGGAIAECTKCGEVVVFNPRRVLAAPKVCFQCASIEPTPFGAAARGGAA
jgi:formylmethanofuran dehydrogenase subunit E